MINIYHSLQLDKSFEDDQLGAAVFDFVYQIWMLDTGRAEGTHIGDDDIWFDTAELHNQFHQFSIQYGFKVTEALHNQQYFEDGDFLIERIEKRPVYSA